VAEFLSSSGTSPNCFSSKRFTGMKLLRSQRNSIPIALSFGIAFVGAYCGINLAEQFRLCTKKNQTKILPRRAFMMLMSFTIGGVAIWSMHFVGMSSVSFIDQFGHHIPIRYRIDFTLISLVVAIILCYIGIYVCSKDAAFTIDNVDTVDTFIKQASKLSISEIKNMSNKNDILLSALFTGMHKLILGGIITAAGVCIMHYIGMMAIILEDLDQTIEIQWEAGIVVASVIIAIVSFGIPMLYPN
jgi:NO-binding membrane sensor protein with MHYT domain